MGRLLLSSLSIQRAIRNAINECPPRSQKLSRMPMPCFPNTSSQILTNWHSSSSIDDVSDGIIEAIKGLTDILLAMSCRNVQRLELVGVHVDASIQERMLKLNIALWVGVTPHFAIICQTFDRSLG